MVWNPTEYSFLGLYASTLNWTFEISGANNNIITITDIPSMPSGNWFFIFEYSDWLGNVGYIHFSLMDCSEIVSPNQEFSFCDGTDTREYGKVGNFESLKVYPNPVKNFLVLDEKYIGCKYVIHNLEGKNILAGLIGENRVETSSLFEGVYSIRIEKNNNLVGNARFIKVH